MRAYRLNILVYFLRHLKFKLFSLAQLYLPIPKTFTDELQQIKNVFNEV